MFKDKTLLITGGTGSFGHAVLDRFLNSDIGEIRIFSRDEKKQDDMRKEYQSSKIKILYRRCARSCKRKKRYARRKLYLSRRGPQTGAFL